MSSNHTEYWVARPIHSTGFGFASISAVSDAFESAFAHASGSSPEKLDVRLRAAVPVDRRYAVSVNEKSDGSFSASMRLDGVIVADATALFHSSS